MNISHPNPILTQVLFYYTMIGLSKFEFYRQLNLTTIMIKVK